MAAAPRLATSSIADSTGSTPLAHQKLPPADSRYFLAPVGGAAWLVGIGLGSAVHLPLTFWLLMAAAAAAGAAALWRVGRLGLALAGVAALALGGARTTSARPVIDARAVAAYHGAEVALWGRVADEPDVRDAGLRLRVAAEALHVEGQTRPVEGLVLVQTDRYPAIGYGATLRLDGELIDPADWADADYAAYLARQGIGSVMRYPALTVLDETGGRLTTRALLAVRERGRAVMRASLPEPHASLLTGILLGDDSGLPRELRDAFRATGMTHIIAISGFNIALIIGLLDRLSAPLLPRRSATLLIIGLIVAYAALVGGSASVLRAALMGIGYLVGLRFMGRPTMALAGLFTAAFLMTLADPNALWDIGFQLSLAATLGLLLYAGPWLARLQRAAAAVPDPARPATLSLLGDTVVVTLAAQVLALPIILYHFGQLSLVSLPANFLILPAQPAVMLTGGVTLLLGMVWPPLGQVAGLAAWPFLTYTVLAVERLAQVPFAAVPLALSPGGLAAVFVVIAGLTLLARRDGTRRAVAQKARGRIGITALAGAGLVVVVLLGAWLGQRPDGRLHVAFLDVGQGDAILIQSPSGRQVLIDGGRYPSVVLAELGEQMPFWDRALDVVIATHPDDDHVAGLVDVADRYKVGRLVTNGQPAAGGAYAALLAAVDEGAVHTARPGETIDLGDGARLAIIHAGGEGAADNEASVVARLTYGDLTVLLTGDAEAGAEGAMLREGRPLSAVVLKAGHHGANTSSSAEFLRAVAPRWVVISAGAGNSYGHPAEAMLERVAAVGATVLRTDEVETIELISNGEALWWELEGE